ncbi:MAG TPA: flagellar biosynthesis protein FlhB [Tepidisphaeraceae bacterium]|nr:flagellar biosynthesis protein FlhB [Tepidisphaeraceae bacterium]
MADDFGDKTEAPTPRRRQEAREQGNIAKSQDLTAAVLLVGVIVLLSWYGPNLIGALRTITEDMLGPGSLKNPVADTVGMQMMLAIRVVGSAMAPLLLGVMVVAILVNMVQVGFFFTLTRIQPQFSALNPFKGVSKLLGSRDNLVAMAMNILKMTLVAYVAYGAIRTRMTQILTTQQLDFIQIFGLGSQIVYSIALRIGMVLLILAVVDYAWNKYRTEQKLKMSKQEIKEEMRRMEGDPHIKQRRRQVAIQRSKQGIRQNVPTADVIVTNPTHFAVAIKYDAKTMHAPKVVAKGADFLAQEIRKIAIEHGIPVLERPPLARAIYKLVDVGQEIPEQFYSAIAEILAYVYEISGKLREHRELATT